MDPRLAALHALLLSPLVVVILASVAGMYLYARQQERTDYRCSPDVEEARTEFRRAAFGGRDE